MILALKWSDFDFGAAILTITRASVNGRVGPVKTEYSEDEMPLDPPFAEVVLEWREQCPPSDAGWLFPHPTTGWVCYASDLQGDILVPAGQRIGVDCSVGSLCRPGLDVNSLLAAPGFCN